MPLIPRDIPARVLERIRHVERSISLADVQFSALSRDPSSGALSVEGFTSLRVRHLLNNLCAPRGTRYLEIGVRLGASLVAASYGNTMGRVLGVDAWKGDGFAYCEPGARENVARFVPGAELLKGDAFDPSIIEAVAARGPFDVYYYDADHEMVPTLDSLRRYRRVLAEPAIVCWDDMETFTVASALAQLYITREIPIWRTWILPAFRQGDEDLYWNGFIVMVVGGEGTGT